MSTDAFSSFPARGPVALLDLVETESSEARLDFVPRAKRAAEESGGRMVLANEAVAPMIVPDETVPESDDGVGLLVVTEYPTKQAGQQALDMRKDRRTEVRTFAAQPVNRVESVFGRTLPYTLGLLGREAVPRIDDPAERDAVIRRALVLGEQPDEERWVRLTERAGDRPIWMLNFLHYRKTAVYAEDARDAAPDSPISGAHAYRLYGSGMIRSLASVGGRVAWSGLRIGQVAGPEDGRWHQIAIAHYPSPSAMMTMLALPKYRAAHVHRDAALERTRLLATQPI